MTTDSLTTADALAAVRASSWVKYDNDNATCGHPGCTDHAAERKRIHTRSLRGFGADWDLVHAEEFIASAKRCVWAGSMLGHELRVIGADDRVIYFEVERPDGDAA